MEAPTLAPGPGLHARLFYSPPAPASKAPARRPERPAPAHLLWMFYQYVGQEVAYVALVRGTCDTRAPRAARSPRHYVAHYHQYELPDAGPRLLRPGGYRPGGYRPGDRSTCRRPPRRTETAPTPPTAPTLELPTPRYVAPQPRGPEAGGRSAGFRRSRQSIEAESARPQPNAARRPQARSQMRVSEAVGVGCRRRGVWPVPLRRCRSRVVGSMYIMSQSRRRKKIAQKPLPNAFGPMA